MAQDSTKYSTVVSPSFAGDGSNGGGRTGPPFPHPVRSLSTSPPRRAEPAAAGKLQLVAVGNRFCLARQGEATSRQDLPSATDAGSRAERLAPGRGDSADSLRVGGGVGWPAALRSRSSSDEGSIHRYPMIKQKKASQ